MSDDKKEPVFEFGGPCPPIRSWFFPNDPSVKPYEIDEPQKEGEGSETTQSLGG